MISYRVSLISCMPSNQEMTGSRVEKLEFLKRHFLDHGSYNDAVPRYHLRKIMISLIFAEDSTTIIVSKIHFCGCRKNIHLIFARFTSSPCLVSSLMFSNYYFVQSDVSWRRGKESDEWNEWRFIDISIRRNKKRRFDCHSSKWRWLN